MSEHQQRVLIIEDHDDTRLLYRIFLESCGFEVCEAPDGIDGLAQALASPPDAIVLDIGLPRLDGFEVARRLRRDPRTAAVAIVAVSAQLLPGYAEVAVSAGCTEALSKPCPPEDLLAAMQRALRRA